MRRIGILGGAFDPVHLGHMALAEDAFLELMLDEVWFMPSAQSPMKEGEPGLSSEARVELLKACVKSHPKFKLETCEIERGGVSYTYETVCTLMEMHPTDSYYWIIGGDQVAQLGEWRNIEELAKLIQFIVITRPGFDVEDHLPKIRGLACHPISSRNLEISSTQVRERISQGDSINDLLPKSVADLIVSHNYYKT